MAQDTQFLSLPKPEGHFFHTVWETMVNYYYGTFTDLFVLFTELLLLVPQVGKDGPV